VTIYSFSILLFLFGTSLLFHVQFKLLLHDMHAGFSRDRSGGLAIPSFSEFSRVYCDPQSQRFGIVNKSEIDVFLGVSCLFDDPVDVGNLISVSSAFSRSSLSIWKFMVHVLLKPGLENFEPYFTSVWDECSCAVVWAFFGITFLGIGMKTDLFHSRGHCWVFQIFWHIECSTFTASSFRIWNNSTGIPSPALTLFIIMLPEAHLTTHFRMSGSRWVWSCHQEYLSLEDIFGTVLCILASS